MVPAEGAGHKVVGLTSRWYPFLHLKHDMQCVCLEE